MRSINPVHVFLIGLFSVIMMASFLAAYDTVREQKAIIRDLVHPRDYQIDLHMDTVWIYDGARLVDSFISDYSSKYDSIIMRDNE